MKNLVECFHQFSCWEKSFECSWCVVTFCRTEPGVLWLDIYFKITWVCSHTFHTFESMISWQILICCLNDQKFSENKHDLSESFINHCWKLKHWLFFPQNKFCQYINSIVFFWIALFPQVALFSVEKTFVKLSRINPDIWRCP